MRRRLDRGGSWCSLGCLRRQPPPASSARADEGEALSGELPVVGTRLRMRTHCGHERQGSRLWRTITYIGRPKAVQVLLPGELVVAQTDLTQAADVIGRVVRVPKDVNAGRLVASLDLAIVPPGDRTPVEHLYGVLLEERFDSTVVLDRAGPRSFASAGSRCRSTRHLRFPWRSRRGSPCWHGPCWTSRHVDG
jgi:hypothetical protein